MKIPGWNTLLAILRSNVSVNVIANLIAGAILYLGGAMFGIFPRSPTVVTYALVTLFFACSFASFIAADYVKDDGKSFILQIAVPGILMACAFLVQPISGVFVGVMFLQGPEWMGPLGDPEWFKMVVGFVYLIFGSIALLAWAILLPLLLRQIRTERREAQRIKGMSWIKWR